MVFLHWRFMNRHLSHECKYFISYNASSPYHSSQDTWLKIKYLVPLTIIDMESQPVQSKPVYLFCPLTPQSKYN